MRGIKADILATRIGVSTRTITMWELSNNLGHNAVEKVAAGLEISADMIHQFDEEAFILQCIQMQVL